MKHSIPTGPAIVGHDSYVLPVRVGVSRRLNETFITLTAPKCRYGPVMYQASVCCADYQSQRIRHPYVFASARGGSRITLQVPASWPDWSVILYLRSFMLDPRAFDRLSDDELLDALSHELSDVREAAFLALQRPRKRRD